MDRALLPLRSERKRPLFLAGCAGRRGGFGLCPVGDVQTGQLAEAGVVQLEMGAKLVPGFRRHLVGVAPPEGLLVFERDLLEAGKPLHPGQHPLRVVQKLLGLEEEDLLGIEGAQGVVDNAVLLALESVAVDGVNWPNLLFQLECGFEVGIGVAPFELHASVVVGPVRGVAEQEYDAGLCIELLHKLEAIRRPRGAQVAEDGRRLEAHGRSRAGGFGPPPPVLPLVVPGQPRHLVKEVELFPPVLWHSHFGALGEHVEERGRPVNLIPRDDEIGRRSPCPLALVSFEQPDQVHDPGFQVRPCADTCGCTG